MGGWPAQVRPGREATTSTKVPGPRASKAGLDWSKRFLGQTMEMNLQSVLFNGNAIEPNIFVGRKETFVDQFYFQ